MADEERSESFEQLQERVNRRVQEALSGLREEIRERLKRAGDHLVGELDRELGDVAPSMPDSFLPREEVEPLAAEAEDAGRRRLLGHLVAAFAALDRAGTQRAVLDALLAEGRRFAGRTALLLTRRDALHLWGAGGWDGEEPGDVSLPWGDGGPWSAGTLGGGTVELGGNDCAPLCSRLDGALPQGGVLVPLVLRDRLAAVLYADHDGGGFYAEALQALTWAAALALEALPFRDREATPTLGHAGAGAAALAVWDAPEADDEGDEDDEDEGDDEVLLELDEAAPEADDAGFDLDEDEAAADVLAGEGYGEVYAADELEEIEEDDEVELSELDTLDDDLADDDLEVELEAEAGWGLETDVPGAGATAAVGAEADEEVGEDTLPETVGAPESASFGAFDAAEGGEPGEGAPSGGEPRVAGFDRAYAEPPPAEEADEAEAAEDEGAASDDAGRAAEDAAPAMETAAAPPPPPAAGAGSPEVAPPSDHSGPGSAFGGGTDEGRHEEARRLARLLVSEIRLYNEELVEQGRRNHDIYRRLKEDIDRSRQIYEERVDAAVREDSDYFYDELVRNLGDGDARTLGI